MKITITKNQKNGDLELRRDGSKELIIKGASNFLKDNLNEAVRSDYPEYLKMYTGAQYEHLGSWLINYLAYAERDILNEFKCAIVIPVSKK